MNAKTLLPICLLSGLLIHASRAEDPFTDDMARELEHVVLNSLSSFKHDFDVTLQSQELMGVLEKELTGGNPIPVSIKELVAENKDGEGSFRVALHGLGLPADTMREIEKQANTYLNKSEINEIWAMITKDFIQDANDVIARAGDKVKVLKQDEKTLLLGADGLNEPFRDEVELNAVRLVVDRRLQLMRGVRMTLSGNKQLIVKLHYDMHRLKNQSSPVPAISSAEIQHNAWLGRMLGLIKLPNKATILFTNYNFK
ncbi:MAG: hypothetical protein AAF492_08855 [Verrucomicrobiota bacterium]